MALKLNSSLVASSELSLSISRHTSPRSFMSTVMLLKPEDAVKNIRKTNMIPYNPKQMTVTYSMHPEKKEIFKYLEDWAEQNLLPMLKPVENSWQPQDFLPDPCSEDFFDRVTEFKSRAAEIPDHYYVCLVGDMITEEALPTYLSFLNSLDGVRDETGASRSPWAQWSRSWTAEENRHGDLLNKYLYLCGRVNMKQVEKTIQYLIASGMNMGAENNPYLGFIYTSFQERATAIAHGNTARQALGFGDVNLAKICGTIASDEKRHEAAYAKIIKKLFDLDPDTTMQAFAKMMRKKITMPGCLMYDGEDGNLFDHYSTVAQETEVYTANDYVEIIEFFVERWNVDKVAAGLSDEGRKAQDYICNLAPKLRKLVERSKAKAKAKGKASPLVTFSWLFNKQV
ncbi:hypothetical protein MRB53_007943 [Persea americana]|uniref:Uncharacterized protein n=1 Tax=Persea americana TaxID=3435 RepID=A0ACC2MKE4_PERAE|nr:hypothetical protein MRB53_007943 [Persea americana]